LALAYDLRERGMLFDEDEVEQMRTTSLGLSIRQSDDLPSTARHLRSGGTGYAFNVVISNDSRNKMLSPCFCDFDGPEWETKILPVPDPGRKALFYFFDLREDGYGREMVLNHFIGRRRTLAPGQVVEGFLLAAGPVGIPWKYREGDHIQVGLSLFDQRGRSQDAVFHLSVERSPEYARMMERIAARKPRTSNMKCKLRRKRQRTGRDRETRQVPRLGRVVFPFENYYGEFGPRPKSQRNKRT
jgi:hypothetical protein